MKGVQIGIDEAGRGPLAGPVAVGVALVSADFNWRLLPGVTDSKALSEKKREEIYQAAQRLRRAGKLDFAVVMSSAAVIDKRGLVPAVRTAMARGLSAIEKRAGKKLRKTTIKLDGSLYAPPRFVNQTTIIKGDQKEKIIGLASIVAKVTRDRYMVRIGGDPQFAPYTFATHKGYGTKAHRQAIKKFGVSPVHRQSYCKNIFLL